MTDNGNAQLIDRFYRAFAARDAAAMNDCYADDATFSDPVFPELNGREVRAMWSMFCERGDDLEVAASDIAADDSTGRAHWDARYTFGPTKRKVENRIDAEFRFRDGKIVEHRDRFDLYRWTRMALGPLGVALGWSPLVQNRVRRTARDQLDRFMKG